jgi:hypothetical protein
MNFFVLLFFAYYAVIFLIIAIPFLLLVSWAVNRWLLKRKLKLRYWILLSIGIPISLVVLAFLDIYYAPYSTSNMDGILSQLVPEIKFPPYKITEYSSVYVGGDDLKDTYHIVFKDGKDETLRSKLDSLVIINPKWKRNGNEYVYDTIFFENEIVDSIIVRPTEGTATFIRYKW